MKTQTVEETPITTKASRMNAEKGKSEIVEKVKPGMFSYLWTIRKH